MRKFGVQDSLELKRRGIITRMKTLFSRTALLVTVGYAVLIAVLLLAVWRVSDFEGRAAAFLIIGLPWIFVLFVLRTNSMAVYTLILILNAATVYVFVLSLVRVFAKDRN
jgi:hypothetical protein